MNGPKPTVSTWLGAGGENPGVEAVDVESGNVHRVIDLPAGHSVYAMAVTDALDQLAIGSRAGEIRVLSLVDALTGQPQVDVRVFRQGAPILSVCFAGSSGLVASDTVGRCLRWNLGGDSARPSSLTVERGVIVALLALSDDELVGLSTAGQLVLWRIRDGEIARILEAPPPPALALVPLIHLPEGDTLLYPGQDGYLVSCGLGDERVQARRAHEGDCSVVAALADGLLTVGRHDGFAKLWDVGCDETVKQISAPPGLISGFALDGSSRGLVLVSETGEAAVFTIGLSRLEVQRRLNGRGYRLVTGPRLGLLRTFLDRRTRDEARRVAGEIRQRLDRSELEGLASLHARLGDLGYDHVSLCLQAEQAARAEDKLGELRARSALIRVLPDGDPAAQGSLDAYLGLLERLWQSEEVEKVRLRLTSARESMHCGEWSAPSAAAAPSANCIIEPDLPLPLIVQAATVLNQPFLVRSRLNRLEPVPCRGVRLQAESLASKYEQLRAESSGNGLPVAALEHVTWVSRQHTDAMPTLMLFNHDNCAIRGLGYACQIREDGTQSVIVPVVVFDPRVVVLTDDPEAHNRRVLLALERIANEALAHSWLGKVHGVVMAALRRLVTASLSDRTRRMSRYA